MNSYKTYNMKHETYLNKKNTPSFKLQASRRGFTFIEIIIVIGIVAIALPMVFGLYFINLKNQVKIYSLQEVKKNGDIALSTIESLIKKDASKIVESFDSSEIEICADSTTPAPTPSSEIYFVAKSNAKFGFYLDSNRIASQSSALPSPGLVYLTNNKVKIDSLQFSCERKNSYSPATVSVSFSVSRLVPTGAQREENAALNFSTKIRLRD
ncbi:MAG TPA: prepilin-type N-terminal cleavage/methylation domain-containing protein [Candidatus Nitrosocosmicus sp.]|nr:prepilin-type N-terminal cleavage/methylation domain-containing protein [Candidatus Nitrosocosmicus sp.]